jgi:hypothetical protein
MTKGTALFDTVTISGTRADVRASRAGCAHRLLSADGVRRPIAIRAAAPACAQYGGGVVDMDDGVVTFKGGSISNTKAVRAPSASCAFARRGMVCYARCSTAGGWRARCGTRMLRRVVYGVRPHAAGVERVSTPFFIVAEGATPSGRGVLHSGARGVRCTMRLRSSCTAWRGFPTGGCSHRGIPCAEAT